MSSPRDRNPGDPFGERPDDGSGWQEPAHLGDDDRRSPGHDSPDPWVPPGWDAPEATERNRAADWPPPAAPEGAPPPTEQQQRPGLFGPRRQRTPGVVEEVFGYTGDLVGAQGWALQHGWTVSDGGGPADAPLAELIAAAPMMRLSKDHRPASVLRGMYGTLEMVAFDVVYASGRYVVPQYAVTAVPMLGTDDGDEFWSAAGHVAAVRPDGHRPQLLEHHARLLTALVAALGVG